MEIKSVSEAVGASSYPGRGIIAGKSPDGSAALAAYFIMGRSINSRNRIFVPDGDGLRTEAFDPALLKDPSLIIYSPVRVFGNRTIFTNGDQTDTIYDFVKSGLGFDSALRTRRYEPDAPNFTPRISAMITLRDNNFTLNMAVNKKAGDGSLRMFFDYSNPEPALGRFIHTYKCDGDPLPSFEGEPELVKIPDSPRALADEIWSGLDPDNRISLWVRRIELATGNYSDVIINKNQH